MLKQFSFRAEEGGTVDPQTEREGERGSRCFISEVRVPAGDNLSDLQEFPQMGSTAPLPPPQADLQIHLHGHQKFHLHYLQPPVVRDRDIRPVEISINHPELRAFPPDSLPTQAIRVHECFFINLRKDCVAGEGTPLLHHPGGTPTDQALRR